jgi:hypothetical protein
MEEGSPMIAPGAVGRYQFTPQPAGFRWYHTHTSAGHDLKKVCIAVSSDASISNRRRIPVRTIRKSF